MKLFYFTDSYPFGIGEQWKANELKELVHHFESITVIPFSYGGNFDKPKALPPGVVLKGPLFEIDRIKLRKSDIAKVIFSRFFVQFFREFFNRGVYANKKRIVSWILGCMNVIRLMKHPVIQTVLAEADKNAVLYFYWGKGACEVLPFTDTARFHKTFVRMHRHDLFEYENRNYIPFRRSLLKSVSMVAPSSQAGKKHLQELYPENGSKVKLVRCGTIGNGKLAKPSSDKLLRVISCSFLSPVKRVNLMIESLQYIEFPIMWYHVGDGPLRKDLEDLAGKFNVSDRFIFKGMMDSRTVLDFYTDNPVDLFVNTSESEGVPFSIMEAFSVGIPVMATDVGGSGEIVDEKTGKLLPREISGEKLALALKEYYYKRAADKNKLRTEVFNRYKEHWDAQKLARELACLLKE
ncbi:MAG: glycosyltransferase [Cyclobacteriaceae bacterium]